MSVTGIVLILFLTFHGLMNVVALVSASGYNMICKFLGASWYAVAGTVVLAAFILIHFIYAIWLTLQNKRARGSNRYDITSKPGKVEWASQNMFVLGLIVVLGLILHLWNFWFNMMFAELAGIDNGVSPTDGIHYIIRTFSCPVFTVLYIIWIVAIWFHLNHGFWSAIQTLGWNGKVWFVRWRVIATIYTTLLLLLFVAVAVAFGCGYTPSDYRPAQAIECTQCPLKSGKHPGAPACDGRQQVSACEGCKASKCASCAKGECCGNCASCCKGECCGNCPECCEQGSCASCPVCAGAPAVCPCGPDCSCEECQCPTEQPRHAKGGKPKRGSHGKGKPHHGK